MREITLPEVINSYVDYHLAGIYTALPCVVVKTDRLSEQRIDVQPIISLKDREGNVTPRPVILSVQVVFPSSSTSSFTFPIQEGDTVLCVFSQRSLDVFKSSTENTPTAANDFRMLDKRDAIAIPGLWSFNNSVNNPKKHTLSHSINDSVITHNLGSENECEVRLKPDGMIIATSPLKIEINAPDVEVNCDNATVNTSIAVVDASSSYTSTSPTFTFNGNMIVNGNFTMSNTGSYTAQFNGDVDFIGGTLTHAGKTIDSTHTHSGVQLGGSNTGAVN